MKFSVYCDNDGENDFLKSFKTLDGAIDYAYEVIDEEHNTHNDSEESIKEMLRERRYYICGYGDIAFSIEEE